MYRCNVVTSCLQDYISDCLGVSLVGFVLIIFGAASAIMSGVIGRLIKFVPHFVFIVVAGLMSAGLLVFLLLWNPVPSYTMVFSFALIWGMTDAVWDTLSSGTPVVFGVYEKRMACWQCFGGAPVVFGIWHAGEGAPVVFGIWQCFGGTPVVCGIWHAGEGTPVVCGIWHAGEGTPVVCGIWHAGNALSHALLCSLQHS